MIRDFCASAEWRKFAESTRTEYRRILKIIEAEYGGCPFPALEDREFRKDVLAWRDRHEAKHRC